MKSPLLGSHALALASFNKARILSYVRDDILHGRTWEASHLAYCMLSLFPSDLRQGVMTLFNVHIEKMICWKILAAFNAPVCVKTVVVGFVIVVEPEPNRLSVGR